MKYIFIADFFKVDVNGGGEIVNDVLMEELRARGHQVGGIRSHEVTLHFFEKYHGANFIIGNFLNLSDSAKRRLAREKYIIYEHDHKYLKTRDPSLFSDFCAPPHAIVNKDFYANALGVICQSKLHAEVVRKNLPYHHIYSAGGNPWSDAELEHVVSHMGVPKKEICGIMDSSNPIKNTAGAIAFCREKNWDYKLIPPLAHEEFIKELAECEKFVFFPTVLETLSRVVIEARMLECQVVTNNLIGATSEAWFALKGASLLEHIRAQKAQIVDSLEEIFQTPSPHCDATVILNAYRRPQNLKRQIESIRQQSVAPKHIWVWVNDHQDLDGFDFTTVGADRIFRNDHNWKFYGRFAAALLAETDYVAIFDDDTIPGSQWLENCIKTMEHQEGILGSAGVILEEPSYNPHQRCGWPVPNEEVKRVDLVGHAWFFKRHWLRYLWAEYPTTWDNGEDIQFSYLAQKYGGINTYCPPHPENRRELHGSIYGNELGIDSKATSTNSSISHHVFFAERDFCVQKALAGGWKTVKEVGE